LHKRVVFYKKFSFYFYIHSSVLGAAKIIIFNYPRLLNIFVLKKIKKMKRVFLLVFLFLYNNAQSQTNYSDKWEDLYSYSGVKDFVKSGNTFYAIVDNAAFSYNVNSEEITKFSSVNGLSGETTSAVHYSSSNGKLIIGYENGLLEIIDENGKVKRIVDISLSDISSQKRINAIDEYDNKIYLSMSFGMVVYDLVNLEFLDTYFIGLNSSNVVVNDVLIFGNKVLAASEDGVYFANLDTNLNDSNNWVKKFSGGFTILEVFNSEVLAVKGKDIYSIKLFSSLELKKTQSSNIIDISPSESGLIVGTSSQSFIYDINYQLQGFTDSGLDRISSVFYENNTFFFGTDTRGVLKSSFSSPNVFDEIHPSGPSLNDVFSITVKNNHLWCVYGGYNASYGPSGRRLGFSHFNGVNWLNTPYDSFKARDLTNVTIDPNNIEKVYISSWSQTNGTPSNLTGGILVVENDEINDFWNQTNSGLGEVFPDNSGYVSIRIDGTAFDSQGNFWITNSLASDNLLKRYSSAGEWTGHDLSISGLSGDLNQLVVDKNDNIWIGSRGRGLLGYSDKLNKNVLLKSNVSIGNLPDNSVTAIAIDKNNSIWIGTSKGLVKFDDVANVFGDSFRDAEPIIVLDDGTPKKLLGASTINDIYIDGAGNKWFATQNGGVIQTNSTGQKTISSFNKENSPLPSNTVLKIQMDESTGKVFFATPKGIVAYKSNVTPYGEKLVDVYSYPNPALKQHNEITIVGKDGNNLPLGTNIKILDVSGNLVFESNAVEGQSSDGGKIVWNKTNLLGIKVASGVYIVLMYSKEGKQTSSTKIAIIN